MERSEAAAGDIDSDAAHEVAIVRTAHAYNAAKIMKLGRARALMTRDARRESFFSGKFSYILYSCNQL